MNDRIQLLTGRNIMMLSGCGCTGQKLGVLVHQSHLIYFQNEMAQLTV